MFKIHSILLTNNESDILAECLDSASKWSDYIYVFDTGSTDKTPEIINKMSKSNPRIIYYKSEFRKYDFTKNIGEVMKHYFHNSSVGDWWCTLCTDEQYPDDPRIFLSKVPDSFNNVWSSTLSYYFTDDEVARIKKDDALQSGDFSSIKYSEFLRYYKNNYSETRFYRHHSKMNGNTTLIPKNFSPIFPFRIAMQHFQYRSPSQIISRVRSRQSIFQDDPLMQFAHEYDFNLPSGDNSVSLSLAIKNSKMDFSDEEILSSRIVPLNFLDLDRKDGKYKFNEPILPKIPVSTGVLIGYLKLFLSYPIANGLKRVRQLIYSSKAVDKK